MIDIIFKLEIDSKLHIRINQRTSHFVDLNIYDNFNFLTKSNIISLNSLNKKINENFKEPMYCLNKNFEFTYKFPKLTYITRVCILPVFIYEKDIIPLYIEGTNFNDDLPIDIAKYRIK